MLTFVGLANGMFRPMVGFFDIFRRTMVWLRSTIFRCAGRRVNMARSKSEDETRNVEEQRQHAKHNDDIEAASVPQETNVVTFRDFDGAWFNEEVWIDEHAWVDEALGFDVPGLVDSHDGQRSLNVSNQAHDGLLGTSVPLSLRSTKTVDSNLYVPEVDGEPLVGHIASNASSDSASETVILTDFVPIKRLRSGAQGSVELVRNRNTGSLFVVKTIEFTDEDEQDFGQPRETHILTNVLVEHQHPNIVALDYVFRGYHSDVQHLFYNFCSGGDLVSVINRWNSQPRGLMPEMFVLHVAASLASALAYLHLGQVPLEDNPRVYRTLPRREAVLHRDIKPDNVFLQFGPNNGYGMPDVILGDLGLAAEASENVGICGTPDYFPPEVREVLSLQVTDPKAYSMAGELPVLTEASDIYTFGLLLYTLVTGELFRGHWGKLQEQTIQTYADPNHLLYVIMHWCLFTDPDERMPSDDLPGLAVLFQDRLTMLYEQGHRMPPGLFEDHQDKLSISAWSSSDSGDATMVDINRSSHGTSAYGNLSPRARCMQHSIDTVFLGIASATSGAHMEDVSSGRRHDSVTATGSQHVCSDREDFFESEIHCKRSMNEELTKIDRDRQWGQFDQCA